MTASPGRNAPWERSSFFLVPLPALTRHSPRVSFALGEDNGLETLRAQWSAKCCALRILRFKEVARRNEYQVPYTWIPTRNGFFGHNLNHVGIFCFPKYRGFIVCLRRDAGSGPGARAGQAGGVSRREPGHPGQRAHHRGAEGGLQVDLDSHGRHDGLLWSSCARIFDDVGDGFITVARFRDILKEIDEDISDEELDGIIADVSCAIKYPSGSGFYV